MATVPSTKWEYQNQTSGEIYCKKDTLHIPKLKHTQRLSLSDIIAATIGDEARSADMGCEEFGQNWGLGTEQINQTIHNFHEDSCSQNGNSNIDNNHTLFSDNSNNALNPDGSKFVINEGYPNLCSLDNDSNSHVSNHHVPELADAHNSNTRGSFFSENSRDSAPPTQQLDFSNMSFCFDSTVDFHTTNNGVENILNSTLQVVPEANENLPNNGIAQTETKHEASANVSYDSDLEDSVHFVMPEEDIILPEAPTAEDDIFQQPKKRRLSEVCLRTCDRPDFMDNPDGFDLNSAYTYRDMYGNSQPKPRMNGINRRRSFSGNITHRSSPHNSLLNRGVSSSNFKTPSLGRTRSFSGAPTCSPLEEERFNTSLNSLMGSPSDNNSLSENPIFNDLKSTLFTDCTSTDCPTSLFQALASGPTLDVYARERNLQSRFSTLQSKHPEEVRKLSSFYRCQSAEVETERFRELHDDNLPLSFRNHLNQYYDDQLHTIMERVEKSLKILTVATRDIVSINRSMRPRPLLSRKAVNMMEEWYTRNYEHPYPSQTAVDALAKAGEINPEQVKKWFANKRNRSKNTLPPTEVANRKRKRQFSSKW